MAVLDVTRFLDRGRRGRRRRKGGLFQMTVCGLLFARISDVVFIPGVII